MVFANWLTKLFPPPRALVMPTVALDVSDTSVKYLQLVRSDEWKGFKISQNGSVPLESGTVVNGSLENPAALAAAIKVIAQKTKTTFVRVSLPEEHAYIFETSLRKDIKSSAMRSAIELKLEENVPLPPREAIFDYLCEEDEFNKNNIRVVVTAYSRTMIEKYADACQTAGVLPISFEVEAEALARAVVPRSSKEAQLILDLGETRTGIGIFEKNALRYTSTIEVGSGEIFLALQKKNNKLTKAEFMTIMNQEGLSSAGPHQSVIEEVMRRILGELQIRLQYWENQIEEKQKPPITTVVLCGGAANTNGMAAYFGRSLDMPVQVANVWQNAFSLDEYIPEIDFAHSLGYATAVGLALGDHERN